MGKKQSKQHRRNLKKQARKNKLIEKSLDKDQQKDRNGFRILLLGTGDSGKSTIVKQMQILYKGGFKKTELDLYKKIIRANIKNYIKKMLIGCESLNIEIEEKNQQLSKDYLESNTELSIEINEELKDKIKTLWKDKAIQESYERRDEFELHDAAKYFLNNIDRICEKKYVPSSEDILYCRVPTVGVKEIRFEVKDHIWRLIDVGGQRSERRKWIHHFNNVDMLIFIVSMSEYNQKLYEEQSTNRMLESIEVFNKNINNEYFKKKNLVLLLNKIDLFKSKIEKYPLTTCFPEYTGENNFEETSKYIVEQYLSVVKRRKKRKISTNFTCSTDTDMKKKKDPIISSSISFSNSKSSSDSVLSSSSLSFSFSSDSDTEKKYSISSVSISSNLSLGSKSNQSSESDSSSSPISSSGSSLDSTPSKSNSQSSSSETSSTKSSDWGPVSRSGSSSGWGSESNSNKRNNQSPASNSSSTPASNSSQGSGSEPIKRKGTSSSSGWSSESNSNKSNNQSPASNSSSSPLSDFSKGSGSDSGSDILFSSSTESVNSSDSNSENALGPVKFISENNEKPKNYVKKKRHANHNENEIEKGNVVVNGNVHETAKKEKIKDPINKKPTLEGWDVVTKEEVKSAVNKINGNKNEMNIILKRGRIRSRRRNKNLKKNFIKSLKRLFPDRKTKELEQIVNMFSNDPKKDYMIDAKKIIGYIKKKNYRRDNKDVTQKKKKKNFYQH
ncbi:guanine nucleotide-binding protein g(o) subunit alpha [Anaeramoeba flamelloides]|uniref:Guanine nucleotide-binding protein g(O) subunit alpha n=1 Tax=Anaeramoeba flamelloides TaxID=1746091 RepID=A0AAV8AAC8_9EUKA|nr:guanine nucleotide-binding protein g(o) subunit alpha [Anaeramoeba flamelloides]